MLRIFIFFLLFYFPVSAMESQEKYNVYVLHSEQAEFYWNFEIRNAIKSYFDSSFNKISITHIPINYNEINQAILNDPEFDFFKYTSNANQPALLVTIDRISYEFVIKHRSKFFKNIPLVFSGIADYERSLTQNQENLTGIVELVDVKHLLQTAITLHQGKKNFIVILDSTAVSFTNRSLLLKEIPSFREHKFILMEKPNVSEIARMDSIESSSIVLLFGCLSNNSGSNYSYAKSALLLSKTLSSPIYSLTNLGMSLGVLGGRINKRHNQGIETAELIKRIMKGENVNNIPIKINRSNKYIFDYRLIEKYNLDLSQLPENSHIIKRPEALFDKYGTFIILIVSVILVLVIIIIFLTITFRKRIQAERALLVSQSRLNLALNATNDGIWDWNLITDEVYFSPRWVEILGYAENEVEGNLVQWKKLLHPDDLESTMSALDLHMKNMKQTYEAEYRMLGADGEWKWILDRGRIVERDSNKKPLRMIGTHQDITQRKSFEVRLLESERKFRSIFESSTDGIALLDENGVIIEWNKGQEQITGIPKEEAIGKPQIDVQSMLLPDNNSRKILTDEYREEIKQALQKGSAPWLNKLMEVEIICKNSVKKIAQQIVFPIPTKSGFMAGSITRDITEIKKTEEALRRSEKKFRELTDMLPQTVFEIDLKGNLTFGNSVAFEQFGRDRDTDPHEINVMDYIAPEDRLRAQKNLERVLRNEKLLEEYTAVKYDGTRFPVLIHSTPIWDTNSVVGFRGIIIDITERKRSEEARIESEAKYRTLIETQSEGVMLTDLDENITFSNPSANLIFGITGDSIVGKNLQDFTTSDEFNKIRTHTKERMSGIKSVFELGIIRKDGIAGCIHFTVTPYRNRSGEIIGGFAVFTDITQRKKSEADLIKAKEEAERSNKLKTEFLAQVSHEIRTPINSILSFTSLLKDELEEHIPDDLKSSFQIIENGGRRLIRTIDLILNMSQIQTGTYEGSMVLLDLEKDVLDVVTLEFLPSIKEKNLDFRFVNNNVTKKILADHYTITQIFTNLIDNAIKYTPAGKITVCLSNKDNNDILVEVSDTGIGISKEYLPHLFTAFSQEESGYTRRFDGNGLGLALVKKYCELNNARIEVISEKEKGTNFRVYFKPA